MKNIYHLPEPKNKNIIRQIIGQNGKNIRKMEKDSGIKPYDIRQKKNEVHIIGTEKQVEKVIKILEGIIEKEQKLQEDAKDNIVVPIPAGKTGLIMGDNGNTIKSIEEETNTKIDVREKAAHIKGSPKDKEKAAEKIRNILKKSESTQSTDGKTKVNIPVNCKLGGVIGSGHCNITNIRKETGACVQVIENGIYVSGEPNNCKQAIIKIKMKVNEVLNKKPIPDQFNFIHTNEQCDYRLQQSFDCPNLSWNGEKHFKVCRIEEDNEAPVPGLKTEELNTEELQAFICKVLKDIQQENEGQEIKADLWCHFGHLYIGKIDEADQSKDYKLNELQKELRQANEGCWRLRFDPAIKKLEFEGLENTLKEENNGAHTIDPHVRHDFQFLTPDYTSVRAKVFMDMDGNVDSTFSTHDIDIREHQPFDKDAAASPKYLLCDQFETKARVNIMILSEGMDCRLAIRTVSHHKSDDKAKELEQNLTKYLDKISVVNKEVRMPEDSEMPDDYCMYYGRKCKRRSYPYKTDEGEFSVTISEEENVMDISERGKEQFTKTDIHLHCDEWDRLLTSGKWKPEQIVEKLPQFLEFVRSVQSYVQDP